MATATRPNPTDLARGLKDLPPVPSVAGLVHDLGLLVCLRQFPHELRRVCASAAGGTRDFCDLEREIIGMDHQAMGAALAEHWRLPPACRLVAAHHHAPVPLPPEDRAL